MSNTTTPTAQAVPPGVTIILPYPAFDAILETTYGVELAAVFVSCGLFGVFALQVFIYYHGRRYDNSWVIRCLPAYLFIVELLHQFLICVAIYKVLIPQFGNEIFAGNVVVPELFVGTMFQAFCASGAQFFYTYRIWRFTEHHWIRWLVPCITLPLSALQLAMTLANCSLTLIHGSLAYVETIAWTTYTTHATNAFLDVFFVVAMINLLKKEKTAFTKTTSMVNRLTIVIVNTGLATTVFTLLTIIFLAVRPNTLIYVFFNFMISPLYGNSVLANLNSREYIRGGAGSTVQSSTDFPMATVKFNANSSSTQAGGDTTRDKGHTGINVSSTIVTRDDYDYQVKYADA